MEQFSYAAYTADQIKQEGFILASSAKEARQKLRDQGLFVCALSKVRLHIRSLSLDELLQFTEQIYQLLRSGLALYEAFAFAEKEERSDSLSSLFASLRLSLKEGLSLSQALGKVPGAFDEGYCAMIRAAESSGLLEELLKDMLVYLKRRKALRDSIITRSIYPLLLFGSSLCLILFFLLFIIPSMEDLFSLDKMKGISYAVFRLSALLRAHWLFFLAIVSVAPASLWLLWKKPSFRRWRDARFLSLPLLGELLIAQSLARFSRSLSLLLRTAVPMEEALNCAIPLLQSDSLEKLFLLAKDSLIKGETMSLSLRRSPLIPHLFLRLLSLGEERGELDRSFLRLAELYEEEMERKLERAGILLQPLILLLMGSFLASILLALLLPFTDISSLAL